ncbi:MAG: NAD-dependent DNA ligase LigA [Butyrivibrio sp.]|nr:NAD-dependent DNA ligase LigA [Butyrivibrio sp.]MBR1642486.1 NAD-dependent DNA ligase LigA [Butyrivibrio sp.]
MASEEIKREYSELVKTIRHHMDLYYNQDTPEISDYEYDQLMQRLKAIEKENPEIVLKDSPSQVVGGTAKREAGVKITHNVPMLSIEDVFNYDDVKAFVNRVHEKHPDAKFSVEQKIDGLSLTLRYNHSETDGKLHLSLAETRGDGLIGEDVTLNALVIPDVQKIIDLPYDYLELRGEVYMSHDSFEAFNEAQERDGKKLAANPRNLAAGTLRQLDPEITKSRGLKMFVFNVQDGPEDFRAFHCASMDKLEKSGVKTVFHKLCSSADEVIAAIEEIGEMRNDLEFDLDGAVVKVDNVQWREDYPAGSKYSSGHIAYKYPPEEREVIMEDILVDVGRTGKLTFTGIFRDKITRKAARLCGTKVSRATLHNQDYIKEMKIGLGGVYKVFKSGEIIPKLNGCVTEPAEVFVAPAFCPVCGSKLYYEDKADMVCNNSSCPSQLSRTLSYFASVDAMNIIGLGEAIIEKLINAGYLHNFSDIYNLNKYENELISNKIIGLGKSTKNTLKAVEESKKNDPTRLLIGFGIRNVGKNTAKLLMEKYNSISELAMASMTSIMEINDIGETTAQCVFDFFNNDDNKVIIEKLQELGVNMVMTRREKASNILSGLTIVVTGTLPTLGRKEVTELIEDNGGKCASSVSKKTDYLVAGEAAGSKLTKAQSLGIPIISEEELFKMINKE